MRVRPNLSLFTFAAAATLIAGCERRDPEASSGNVETKAPINPVAKGIDAPVEPAPAPAQ